MLQMQACLVKTDKMDYRLFKTDKKVKETSDLELWTTVGYDFAKAKPEELWTV